MEDIDDVSSDASGESRVSRGTDVSFNTDLTDFTELTDTSLSEEAPSNTSRKRPRRSKSIESCDSGEISELFREDLMVCLDDVTEMCIPQTQRMPSHYRVHSREHAARAIRDWLGNNWQAFKSNRYNRRDSQQLRRQQLGTLTLYFNWGETEALVGLRQQNRDRPSKQKPVTLKSRTGLMVEKTHTNSIMVSLCKGDADRFWAFQYTTDDQYDRDTTNNNDDDAGDGSKAKKGAVVKGLQHGLPAAPRRGESSRHLRSPQGYNYM